MNKGVKILLIVLAVALVIFLVWYFLIRKPKSPSLGGSTDPRCTSYPKGYFWKVDTTQDSGGKCVNA